MVYQNFTDGLTELTNNAETEDCKLFLKEVSTNLTAYTPEGYYRAICAALLSESYLSCGDNGDCRIAAERLFKKAESIAKSRRV